LYIFSTVRLAFFLADIEEYIMPISDDTIRKIQALMDKAAEIIQQFPGMTQMEALLCANSTMTAREIEELRKRAEHIDEMQEQMIVAELQSRANSLATFKSKIEKVNKS
jgi:hypothetical protein